ncbi:MAG TPA: amidohydrolase family protein, partial [Terrimesophilobacter sp.]|nr:amidohydrolase family protein [Terrimesophilobacter sp.]
RYLAQQFLFNSFHRAGVPLAAGSDWPVTTPNPWQAIAVGVTRVLPGSSAEPLAPSEALPLHVALSAYTRGSALTVGDTEGGRIGVGARADLVQLDRDPFELPPSELHTVKTIGTWASGRRVFGR